MAFKNSATHYGGVAKFFHWTVVLLFVNQYAVGTLMMRLGKNDLVFGLGGGWYYTWHKSAGLVVLAVVLLRLTWRMTTRLPDWAETLTGWEQSATIWVERLLYLCMFLMPVSGYVFTMAGGYAFKLFGVVTLPVLIDKNPTLASIGEVAHVILGYLIIVCLTVHIGLGLKHQLVDKDRFLHRMLPFTRR